MLHWFCAADAPPLEADPVAESSASEPRRETPSVAPTAVQAGIFWSGEPQPNCCSLRAPPLARLDCLPLLLRLGDTGRALSEIAHDSRDSASACCSSMSTPPTPFKSRVLPSSSSVSRGMWALSNGSMPNGMMECVCPALTDQNFQNCSGKRAFSCVHERKQRLRLCTVDSSAMVEHLFRSA